ncbi:MarR family winged helix-turn-helix transcriptional regulator [Microbacterium memoriense]|uniref:MarR family transcriptional regulator n=1 Tax=Microbacterium memoriense TaxID=2978350 RepID=A0ABT2P8N4_9MICO|nr:MarR family transcriptional regulator [Microbacterium memoriense]MCT9001020.1 MarR family transcriptional regulator [Microbacterium memoriense]
MTGETEEGSAYWYADTDEATNAAVLQALRSYRAAEMAMRRRTQQSMDMGENELLVLRYLARASKRDEPVTPVHLARYLGITSASTTALLDRLSRSGHVTRMANPADRRSILITSSAKAEEEVRHTLSAMHARMMDVVRPMTGADRASVIGFLQAMRDAVDEIDA